MQGKCGVTVESVVPGSPADSAGLRPGDVLFRINSFPLRDAIDFMFHKDSAALEIEYRRDDVRQKTRILVDEGVDPGIVFKPFRVRICRNNCIFCFVKQLPKGLRKSLYVKDEDYRLSFLYGNYMTLSNLTDEERQRIVEQRLSPIYVSVHTTNRALRSRMLGNPKAPDIMKELKFFANHKIRMHIQIVLCPGYNDNRELKNTIQDVYKLYPYVSSIAVVPVGLTKHQRQHIAPVAREDAVQAIRIVESFQKRFRKKHGESIVHCSDEMYIKAGASFHPLAEYGDLAQIENGVGMVPLFLSQARRVKIPNTINRERKFLAFTGVSFYPFLKKFTARLAEKEHISIDVIPVENRFFGPSVTVTGLLTGRDVIAALHDNAAPYDVIIVPDVALKDGEDVFLDDVSLKDIEEATGVAVAKTEGTPQGLVDTIAARG